jgi:hypothetical protein
MSSRGAKRSVDDDSLLGGDAKRAILHAEQVGRLHASGTLLAFLDAALRESMLPMFEPTDAPALFECGFVSPAVFAAWFSRLWHDKKHKAMESAIMSGSIRALCAMVATAPFQYDWRRHEILRVAVDFGTLEMIDILIDNAEDVLVSLCAALRVRPRRFDVVHALIARGMKINGQHCYARKPLIMAIDQHWPIGTVTSILDAGADVNIRDLHTNTPLWTAVHTRQTAIVRLLLDRGADVNDRRAFPGLSLDSAVSARYSRPAILAMLLAHPNIDIELAVVRGVPRADIVVPQPRRSARLAAQ